MSGGTAGEGNGSVEVADTPTQASGARAGTVGERVVRETLWERTGKPRLALPLVAALAGLGLLTAIHLTHTRRHIERVLQRRSEAALARVGVRGASVHFDGRDATLRGVDAARLARAHAAVRGVEGVRHVRDVSAVSPAAVPGDAPDSTAGRAADTSADTTADTTAVPTADATTAAAPDTSVGPGSQGTVSGPDTMPDTAPAAVSTTSPRAESTLVFDRGVPVIEFADVVTFDPADSDTADSDPAETSVAPDTSSAR